MLHLFIRTLVRRNCKVARRLLLPLLKIVVVVVAMADILLEGLQLVGDVGDLQCENWGGNTIDPSLLAKQARIALIDAGFTEVHIMYGISDHSAAEYQVYQTRVLILDLLRSRAEWDLWYKYMSNRNAALCVLTVGLWTSCFARRLSVQYPGRLKWRDGHPRPDWWVLLLELAPLPVGEQDSLDAYLRLPDPTRAELMNFPEVQTIDSILKAIPVSVENNMVSTRLPLLRYIDSTFNDLKQNYYSRRPQSPHDIAAFEARKLFLSTIRSRIEWEEWHLARLQCVAFACIFSVGLWTPCCIKVCNEKFPGFETWRSHHPEPNSWLAQATKTGRNNVVTTTRPPSMTGTPMSSRDDGKEVAA